MAYVTKWWNSRVLIVGFMISLYIRVMISNAVVRRAQVYNIGFILCMDLFQFPGHDPVGKKENAICLIGEKYALHYINISFIILMLFGTCRAAYIEVICFHTNLTRRKPADITYGWLC